MVRMGPARLGQIGKMPRVGRGLSADDDHHVDTGGQFGGFGQNSPTESGALVSQISASGPAAQAGIQQGDVITVADGQTVSNAVDLLTILAQKKPGDSITLKIDRNGQTMTVHVHLGELPA